MGWVDCREALPREDGRYLAWVEERGDGEGEAAVLSFYRACGWVPHRTTFAPAVTHWMPPPPPPETMGSDAMENRSERWARFVERNRPEAEPVFMGEPLPADMTRVEWLTLVDFLARELIAARARAALDLDRVVGP